MSVVLRIRGYAAGGESDLDGLYVREYDPNRCGIDPDGVHWCHLDLTEDRIEARQFADVIEALDYWRQARVQPRQDGFTDRPLTAFNVEVI